MSRINEQRPAGAKGPEYSWGADGSVLADFTNDPGYASAPQPPSGGAYCGFRAWVIEQMPAGTVIGNPEWWADRLARAYEANVPAPPSAPVGVEDTRAAFERWVQKRHGADLTRWADSGKYRYDNTTTWWECWQAALAQQPAAGSLQEQANAKGCTVIQNHDLVRLERQSRTAMACERGDLWYWQGDGADFPDSIVCPVVMHANTLRELLAEQPSAVDEAMVDRAIEALGRAGLQPRGRERMRLILQAALATQQPTSALSGIREGAGYWRERCLILQEQLADQQYASVYVESAARGVVSYLDHASFDGSKLPGSMALALRHLRDALTAKREGA